MRLINYMAIFARHQVINHMAIFARHQVINHMAICARHQVFTKMRPLLDGFAHAFDLFGALGPGFPDPNEDGFAKDRESIAGDWQAIGGDMKRVINRYSKKKEKEDD